MNVSILQLVKEQDRILKKGIHKYVYLEFFRKRFL
jgi:hypothetical protein